MENEENMSHNDKQKDIDNNETEKENTEGLKRAEEPIINEEGEDNNSINKHEDIDANLKEEDLDKQEELKEEKELVEKVESRLTSETAREMDESSELENTKKVEAALFIAGRFLTLQELVMLTDINPLMLKEILGKLIEKYNSDERGMEIIQKENMWKMDVRQEYVNMINKLATGNSEFSKAEQETLAIIAYKQPVKQSIIIKIRGNKAYDHVRKFIENGLVVGKRIGHTKELRLSDDFYEYFHIKDNKIEKNNEENEEQIFLKQSDDEDNSGSKQEDLDDTRE